MCIRDRDNMVYGHIGDIVDTEVKLVKGDLGDASVVYPLRMRGGFDAVIHFAAFINVGESVQDPLKYSMNNIARPLVLLSLIHILEGDTLWWYAVFHSVSGFCNAGFSPVSYTHLTVCTGAGKSGRDITT